MEKCQQIMMALRYEIDNVRKKDVVEYDSLYDRYQDILVYNDTRVVLQNLKDTTEAIDRSESEDMKNPKKKLEEQRKSWGFGEHKQNYDKYYLGKSDYINASYIDDLKFKDVKLPKYISAMAPIAFDDGREVEGFVFPRDTIPAFWRMIWEKRIKVVVMLTRLQEGGKRKADEYWVTNKKNRPKTFFPMKVWGPDDENELEEDLSNGESLIIRRKQTVEHMLEHKPLEVTLLQYKGWPDHGAPTDFEPLRDFFVEYRKVRGCHQDMERKEEPPALVHCSAGVGRSGTFILLDCLLDYLSRGEGGRLSESDPTPNVPVFPLLRQLRHFRGQMVQSATQLQFLHRWLDWCLQNREKNAGIGGMGLLEDEKQQLEDEQSDYEPSGDKDKQEQPAQGVGQSEASGKKRLKNNFGCQIM